MITEQTLKQQLRAIIDNEYNAPPDVEPFQLALIMMEHIGSVDYELRDDLIASILGVWIWKLEIFNGEQLRELLQITLDDDHIFCNLGEVGSDSVFTRAFSMLMIPLILIQHRRGPFLSKDEIQTVKQNVLRCLAGERDRRGYVPGKGWAHAIAHAADALDDLAQCEELGASDLGEILAAAQDQIAIEEAVYVHEEDERMSYAIINLLKRDIVSEGDIQAWLDQFVTQVEASTDMPGSMYRRANVKNFLRSLYFRARREKLDDTLCRAIYEAVEKVTRF